jgi:hypothetical protein
MGLRSIAESDLSFILEDDTAGFGWPITVTDPDGLSANVVGTTRDIGVEIDPETGQYVAGRSAGCSLRISTLLQTFSSLPLNVMDTDKRPWIVEFNGLDGTPYKFKVFESQPDKTLGVITLGLEVYSSGA